MIEMPWMFKVSDLELRSEQKLSNLAPDYLYVLIDGSMSHGTFTIQVQFSDGSKRLSGNGESDVDRLGEDMWGQQAFSAIPLGRHRIQEMLDDSSHGKIDILPTSILRTPDLKVNQLRFFRILEKDKTYVSEEITTQLPQKRCLIDTVQGLNSSCTF
jgi:hypothetical protein